MKVIIAFTFCCDNLWKSKFMALEKPGKLREFFPTFWPPFFDSIEKFSRMKIEDVCVVSVQAALTYAEAQMKIDDPEMTDDVTVGLRHLNNLAKILKQRRQQNGFVNRRD